MTSIYLIIASITITFAPISAIYKNYQMAISKNINNECSRSWREFINMGFPNHCMPPEIDFAARFERNSTPQAICLLLEAVPISELNKIPERHLCNYQ